MISKESTRDFPRPYEALRGMTIDLPNEQSSETRRIAMRRGRGAGTPGKSIPALSTDQDGWRCQDALAAGTCTGSIRSALNATPERWPCCHGIAISPTGRTSAP